MILVMDWVNKGYIINYKNLKLLCVIVVTPSLNKSFKFDSVWPENSSQAYLLQNLVEDVKGDSKASLEKTDNGYIIKSTVNYPNNEDLSYQKI